MTTSSRLHTHAPAWAAIACDVLDTPYPYGAAHQSQGPADCDVTPHRLHPAFHGSLDWHSSVHMQWSLLTLLTVAPGALDKATTRRAVDLLDARLTAANLRTEADYLRAHPGYERPYGWAWAAMLAAATPRCPRPEAARWADATAPLLDAVADLVPDWLDRQTHPVRHGVHSNTAFALSLLHRAAQDCDRADLAATVEAGIRRWYGADTAYDTRFEPSGQDFLSPALSEAQCVLRVLPPAERAAWLAEFLPGLGAGGHAHLLDVPQVRDGTDGHLAHFYGLALSRAWHLRALAPHLPGPAAARARAAAEAQVEATLPVVVGGHFMATHWLVSFALLGELTGAAPAAD